MSVSSSLIDLINSINSPTNTFDDKKKILETVLGTEVPSIYISVSTHSNLIYRNNVVHVVIGKNDDDFAEAIAEFDKAFRSGGLDIIAKTIRASKNAGNNNNGDLAILVVS